MPFFNLFRFVLFFMSLCPSAHAYTHESSTMVQY
uniref:Fimbrial protein n=1 Tax=Arundo donax TaxID=35708 RepID=A0A0A9GV89_ARUDO